MIFFKEAASSARLDHQDHQEHQDQLDQTDTQVGVIEKIFRIVFFANRKDSHKQLSEIRNEEYQ